VAKSGQLCGSKLRIEDGGTDPFKRRFYMNVAIMCRVRSVYPKVTLGIFEECGIMRGGGF
jgi:N-acetylglucosamine-6-phosphate deacetylase